MQFMNIYDYSSLYLLLIFKSTSNPNYNTHYRFFVYLLVSLYVY